MNQIFFSFTLNLKTLDWSDDDRRGIFWSQLNCEHNFVAKISLRKVLIRSFSSVNDQVFSCRICIQMIGKTKVK